MIALDLLTLQRTWSPDPEHPIVATDGDVRLVTTSGEWRAVGGAALDAPDAARLTGALAGREGSTPEPVRDALAAIGREAATTIEGGPVFAFGPEWVPSTTTVELLTSSDAGRREVIPSPLSWDEDEWTELVGGGLGPWAAVLDGDETVALAHTPKPLLPVAAECGVWTHPGFRGRGLAAAAASAWAQLVSQPGRALFYSADHRNAASRRVAERLGLRHLGWQWTASFADLQEADAWGAALEDHRRGRWTPTPELEVEGGGVGDAMHPEWFFRRFDEWDWWERELLPIAAQGPALDLGAGAGRTSLWLQERGVTVRALDSSPGAVDVCRARGVVDARVVDLNDPPADERWRAVFLLCGNLGLGGSWDGIRRLLRRLADITAPDAVVVADTVDPHGPSEIGLRIRYKGMATPWWRQHNVPIAAMADLVAGTGWTIDRHLIDGVDHAVLLRKPTAHT